MFISSCAHAAVAGSCSVMKTRVVVPLACSIVCRGILSFTSVTCSNHASVQDGEVNGDVDSEEEDDDEDDGQ